MDVKKWKNKGYSGDPYKNPDLANYPSAYRIATHFEKYNTISEASALIQYGEIAVASKIAMLKSVGYEFKYERIKLGFMDYSHEWTIIRD
jgi:hypothetical protein